MPYSNVFTTKLGDLLEELRDVIADLAYEDDADKDALSELYDAESSLEAAIAELKK